MGYTPTPLISPVSGYVTQAATTGQVMIVGAPVVRIKPDERALVDTYVTPEQFAKIHHGTTADITWDSNGGKVLHATIDEASLNVAYPPTSFPTDVVHMTRTVKLSFRLDSDDAPPAGTPVDITIHTN